MFYLSGWNLKNLWAKQGYVSLWFPTQNTSEMTWQDHQKDKIRHYSSRQQAVKKDYCLFACVFACQYPNPRSRKMNAGCKQRKLRVGGFGDSRIKMSRFTVEILANLQAENWIHQWHNIGQRKIWSLTSIQMVSHFWPLTQLLLFLNICPAVVSHLARGG